MNRIIHKLRAELEAKQQEIAIAEMLRPHLDADHGVIAGRYQGIQIALDTLENLLRDQQNEDKA